ncbi:sigma-70 family RNA polymerase sigma factor [Gracilibacillus kekensis]|uniref:RNA polymerase sigma factor n=1 Tax=Gracilibacillus kekensis TaxID=1027249 RepID=A0A1M7PRU3_9BACI|nr:sigma-70 family RNA polymerase sigma factor [Gracilibacillus kekensis]SHN20096.1 RNA polymerase, sigma subunit, SigX [Gracilibacillus kekensis]
MKTTFENLYDNYHQDLFQFVFYMVKDIQQTEDIVQDVYIKVLHSYDNFKGDSTEKTWLFSIARHVTFDHFRKLKRKRNKFLEFFNWSEDGEQLRSSQFEPEEYLLLDDQMKQIYHCLEQCSDDQKQVIILRYIQDFNINETTEILGWSTSKVKTTQHRALKILQQCVKTSEREEDDYGEV